MTFLDYIVKNKSNAFKWGMNDCFLFPANAFLEITGVDYAAGMRGYSTEIGAWITLKRKFNTTDISKALEIIACKHGFQEVEGEVIDGDLTTVRFAAPSKRFPAGVSLALIVDKRAWVPGVDGLLSMPLSNIESKVWRVK